MLSRLAPVPEYSYRSIRKTALRRVIRRWNADDRPDVILMQINRYSYLVFVVSLSVIPKRNSGTVRDLMRGFTIRERAYLT